MQKKILILLFTLSLFCHFLKGDEPIHPLCFETFVHAEDTKLFCRLYEQGEPLIVLHGGPGLSQDYLLPYLAELAQHHLVIFYDQRGSGGSQGEILPSEITVDQFVEDINTIRKNFGFNKISVLGHSWGGFLAMQFAIFYPDCIDKLILMNSIPASSEDYALFLKEWYHRVAPFMREIDSIKQSLSYAEGNPETVDKHLKIIFRTYCFDPQKVDELQLLSSPSANVRGSKTFELFAQNFFSKSFNILCDLQSLSCRTLIIHGDVDPIPVPTIKHMQEHIPHSKLIVLKECGHFPYVEQPKALFLHLNAFLTSKPLPTCEVK